MPENDQQHAWLVDLRDDLMLVVDILDARAEGHTDPLAGNGDEDLLAAAETARDGIARLIEETHA